MTARHCDDYIDDPAQPECLRRFLDYARLSPSLKYPTGDEAFDAAIEARLGHLMWRDLVPVLFARHEGRLVRVTMASRFGDVGISEDLAGERGYGKRVAVEELTGFSDAIVMSTDCAQGREQTFRDFAARQSEEAGLTWLGMHQAAMARPPRATSSNTQPIPGMNRAQRRAARSGRV